MPSVGLRIDSSLRIDLFGGYARHHRMRIRIKRGIGARNETLACTGRAPSIGRWQRTEPSRDGDESLGSRRGHRRCGRARRAIRRRGCAVLHHRACARANGRRGCGRWHLRMRDTDSGERQSPRKRDQTKFHRYSPGEKLCSRAITLVMRANNAQGSPLARDRLKGPDVPAGRL